MMATRTIESRRSRIVTMLILPLMSCSARLPIYIMITGAFFPAKYRALVMVSLYFVGIALAVLLSRLFGLFLVKGNDTPFVMELPPYRFPTWKAIGRHTWEKGKQYLKKMGGIILVASILVWALGYFPHDDTLSDQQQQEQSYIGRIGKLVEPVRKVSIGSWMWACSRAWLRKRLWPARWACCIAEATRWPMPTRPRTMKDVTCSCASK